MATNSTKSNSSKSTHSGHCQICGSLQKLPSGVLSKHGYTKQFGFFNGTCTGSDWSPFELSCGRVAMVISQVEGQVTKLTQDIDKLKIDLVLLSAVPFLQYRPRHQGGPVEVIASVYQDVNGQNVININGTITSAIRHSLYGTPRQIAEKLVDKRIGRLRDQINQRQQYIDWQRGRVENWVAAPEKLIPNEKGVAV